MNFLCIYLGEGRGRCTKACICMGTHSQSLLQNRLMDVYKTWLGGSNHGPAHAYRLFGQIRPEVEPRRRKNGSMRGPFSKGLLLQIGMQQHWIEISWLFAVRTDFTNLTVMLSDLLRNLTFNRSAHCTQVSDQYPLGLLLEFSVRVRSIVIELDQISSFFSLLGWGRDVWWTRTWITDVCSNG